MPVAPVAYQVLLEPGIGQFREFESPREVYSYKTMGTFSCAQIDLRKARERELATLDERSTSSGIPEPFARQKLKARTGWKDDTCDHGLSRSWKVKVCEENNKRSKNKNMQCAGGRVCDGQLLCLVFVAGQQQQSRFTQPLRISYRTLMRCNKCIRSNDSGSKYGSPHAFWTQFSHETLLEEVGYERMHRCCCVYQAST